MNNPIISLEGVEKRFGSNLVVKKMNLEIAEGEFLTLLGPSGCGKTTTLRMIAGFEEASAGVIKVEGERIEDKEPFQRNVNTVFQNYALFPHMTVFNNVAYGLTIKKVPKPEIQERVMEMLRLVQLEGFEKRKPDELSGGQKQRVAIARALVNKPKVLLLDEPLGALDLKLRKQMQIELKRLQKKLGITFIYITHDQEEAMTMSDRIAVMNAGVIEHLASPSEIYNQPKTRFVANFIGESNIFTGEVKKLEDHIAEIKVEQGDVKMELSGFEQGEQIHVCVRPEVMKYSKTPVDGFSLEGTVKNVIFVGAQYRTLVTMDNGYDVKINRVKHDNELKEGDRIYLYWDLEDATGIKAQEVEA